MRKFLLLALGSIGALMSCSAIAAPKPIEHRPLPAIKIERQYTVNVDLLKRYITAAMPVFSAADLVPQKLDSLNHQGITLPKGKRSTHVLRQFRVRSWLVQHNRYFTGRVSDISYKLVQVPC